MNPTPPPGAARPRAVLHLRQSVAREESISLEVQETSGRTYCTQQGYEVVAVKSDPGIRGRTWNRPAVQRVMTMIESGATDNVILWRWSRLSRSRLEWAVAVDKVENAGGRIESATESVDISTSRGRLARGMLAVVKGQQPNCTRWSEGMILSAPVLAQSQVSAAHLPLLPTR
ncbi:recombinase family protein [Nesterenkonia aurantiaca]|uniref:recombinase family protein n=1 Tax=Nesterenkonia aurantiaca TaxID=1436010 RepID=UPI003EE48418